MQPVISEKLIRELSDYSQVKSPVFGLKFRIGVAAYSGIIQFYSNTKIGFSGAFKLMAPLVTTPSRFESWLIRVVLRTKFVDYKVTGSRYEIDFEGMDKNIIDALFSIALDENKNTSWLVPLQELLLKRPPKLKTEVNKYLGERPEGLNEEGNRIFGAAERALARAARGAQAENDFWHVPFNEDEFLVPDQPIL